MTDMGTKRVALVIGSGSVKCAAALGLAKVLQREGIACSMLVGCSAGAMFAAILAAGHDIDRSAEMTRRLWTQDITREPDRRALLSVLLPGLFGFNEQFGLRHDRLIMQRLREGFGRVAIEDMLVPLFITATDFANGEQVVMDRGSVVEAVRASIAMPFIFKPWRMDGRLLVDGFLSDPLPVGVAIREGADVIIAMGFESPPQSRISSIGRFAFQYSSIMNNNLLKSRFAFHNLAHHSEIIPVIPEFRERIRLFDTAKIPYIMEQGERAMEAQLPYLRELLRAAPRAA